MKKTLVFMLASLTLNFSMAQSKIITDSTHINFEKGRVQKRYHEIILVFDSTVHKEITEVIIKDPEASGSASLMVPSPINIDATPNSPTDSTVRLAIGIAFSEDVITDLRFAIIAKDKNGDTLNGEHVVKVKYKKDPIARELFFQEDIMISNSSFGIQGFIIDQNGFKEYEYVLMSKSNDSISIFKMYNIEPDVNSISIFRNELENSYNKLKLKTAGCLDNNDVTYINNLANISSDSSFKFSLLQKDTLDYLYDKLENCENFKLTRAFKVFEPLMDSLKRYGNLISSLEIDMELKGISKRKDKEKESSEKEISNSSSALLYRSYLASLKLNFENIPVGKLKANSYVNLYPFGKEKKKAPKDLRQMRVIAVKLEFEREQLVNVCVHGKVFFKGDTDSTEVMFHSKIPFPYSRKKDVIHDRRGHFKIRAAKSNRKMKGYQIYLDEVFVNDYYLLNNTENYAPKDTIVVMKPCDPEKIIYKPKTVNLLKANIYSDFIGLDETNPNGLLQTEISNRIFLNPSVHQISNYTYTYFGFINSFQPKLVINKLENNQKNLIPKINFATTLNPIDSMLYDTTYVSTTAIDLYRHTRLESGGELNIGYIGLPSFHLNIYFNIGAFIRLIDVQIPDYTDSTYLTNRYSGAERITDYVKLNDANVFTLNTVWVYPEFAIEFNPHPLIDVGLTAKFITMPYRGKLIGVKAENYEFKWDNVKNMLLRPHKIFSDLINLKFEVGVNFPTPTKSKVFFRSYITFNPQNINQDFFQMQVGYSRDILNFKRK